MGSITSTFSQSNNFNLLYLDYRGNLRFDQLNSPLGSLIRAVTSFLRMRSYNLLYLFPMAQKRLPSSLVTPLAEKVCKKVGITSDTLKKIELLSRYYFDPNQEYTEGEIDEIHAFVERISGDQKLNAAVNQLLRRRITLDKVHVKMLKMVSSMSFLVPKTKKLSSAFKKVEVLQSGLQKDGTLRTPMEEKLSLKELSELEKVTKLSPLFVDLKKMGVVFDRGSEMGEVRRHVHITQNTLNRIQNIVKKTQTPNLVNFIFYDIPNFSPMISPFAHKVISFIFRFALQSSLSHASMSYQSLNHREVEVHLAGGFIHNRRSLYSQAYKSFAPDLDKVLKLIPKKAQEQLERFYGEEWKEILIEKFGRIVRYNANHSEPYLPLRNPQSRRLLGGLRLKSLFYKGNLLDQMQFSKSRNSICTEFVMKFLMQCYADLEKEVHENWARPAKQGKGLGEAPSLLRTLPKQLTYGAITPSGMAHTLLDSGMVREVERPPILDQILDYHSYDIKKALTLPRFG